jgi:hypothetical protein
MPYVLTYKVLLKDTRQKGRMQNYNPLNLKDLQEKKGLSGGYGPFLPRRILGDRP